MYAYGVEDYMNDPRNAGRSLNTQLSCEGAGAARWDTGDRFFRYLRNVSVEGDAGKPSVEFTQDGVLRAAELKIMNLRPGVSKQLVWEEVSFLDRALLKRTTESLMTFAWNLCITSSSKLFAITTVWDAGWFPVAWGKLYSVVLWHAVGWWKNCVFL